MSLSTRLLATHDRRLWLGLGALALLLLGVVPGALALVFGWLAFRSRITGVYLSIITQAMTYALMLAFFRNEMGFGGNNGLTDFKDILGFNVQADSTRSALLVVSALLLCCPPGGWRQITRTASGDSRRAVHPPWCYFLAVLFRVSTSSKGHRT